ncbi:hypothetical protein Sste5346_005861 [Sporothrix stenoceras]|uniref:DUF7728 domain-containing protein n=1 Tax=Sporothrix stenoceras TaxID=5173 RepID=A0ABR3Z262_9PEZI
MLPKALLAAALASSTASGFLLPPPTDVEMERHHHHKGGKYHNGNNDVEGFEVETTDVKMVSPFYHEFTKVKVPCPGCSMQIRKHGHGEKKEDSEEDGKIITLTDVANHINLFFKIDHQDDGDHLLVNHFELYPNVDINGEGLLATQAPDHFHHKGKGKHHKGKHHDDEKEENEHDEKHDDEEKHEHDDDSHDDELKKRHRRHRKHHDDDEEEKGVEGKHWKPKKDFKDVKFHHVESDNDNKDKEFHHGKHHKHGKHLVKVPLGYAMQTMAVGQDESNGMEVVALSLEIIEVNGVFVQGIPAVTIRLIRRPEGGLMIARVDVANNEAEKTEEKAVEALPGKDRMDALKEELDACTNILCRWKAIISSGIKAHRGGCAGKAIAKAFGGDADNKEDGEEKPHRHHHHKGHHHEDDSEKSDEDKENKEEKPHRHPHHKLREHSWKQLAAKVATQILLPVLMGIVLGIFTTVVGVAVGSLLVSAWRLLFRRKTAAARAAQAILITDDKPTPVAAVVVVDRHANEEAVDEEKAGLMSTESTEELPPYQDNDKKGSV